MRHSVRNAILSLHRCFGLASATLLVLIALTGSIVAFREPLDRWLNPGFLTVPTRAVPTLDPVTLRDRAEAIEPRAAFDFFLLQVPPDRSYLTWAAPKIDPATGKPYDLGYDELYLNPYTGERQGSRQWTHSLMPFLFRLHYSLAIGNPGLWIEGIVALILAANSFLGFYLALPLPRRYSQKGAASGESAPPWFRRWIPSWTIRLGGGRYLFNFDLHRAIGLWTWPMILIFGWSGVALNMPKTYNAVMNSVGLKTRGFMGDVPAAGRPLEVPALGWRAALETGRRLMKDEARRRGFHVLEERSLRIVRPYAAYYYEVKTSRWLPESEFGDAWIIFDANSGERRNFVSFATAPAGDILTRALVALHMATFLGWPMKLLVCLLGLAIAALSASGVIVWLRKRGLSALG